MRLHTKDDTGYPHDGRADNAAYRHDRRADKRRYPHDREIDIQMLSARQGNRYPNVKYVKKLITSNLKSTLA